MTDTSGVAQVRSLYVEGCPCGAASALVDRAFGGILLRSAGILQRLLELDEMFLWAAQGDALDPRGLPPT